MLINQNQNRSYSATSAVTVEGRQESVMAMNANLNNNGVLNFGSSVINMDLYLANRQEVDGDFETFQEYVIDDIGVINNE